MQEKTSYYLKNKRFFVDYLVTMTYSINTTHLTRKALYGRKQNTIQLFDQQIYTFTGILPKTHPP